MRSPRRGSLELPAKVRILASASVKRLMDALYRMCANMIGRLILPHVDVDKSYAESDGIENENELRYGWLMI